MNSLESYIDFSTKGRFAYYLQQSVKHKICLVDPGGYAHRACHIIQQNTFTPEMRKQITLLQCTLELDKLLPIISKKEKTAPLFADLSCGRYVFAQNKFEYYNEYLSLNIKELMCQNKIIFIFLDIVDYLVQPYLDGNGYVVHSVILLFVPSNKSYNCYYINSHGQDMAEYDSYEVIISNRRIKKYDYKAPAEVIFLEEYIKFLNKMEYEDEKIMPIHFKRNKRHIYYGVDLQAGDYHGICWTFPFIIWYYFGKYYNTKRIFNTEYGKMEIKEGRCLLKEGKLGLFIESLFMDFCQDYKKLMVQHLTISTLRKNNVNALQKIIEEKKTHFTKTILKAFMKFILQSSIKKNCATTPSPTRG